MKKSATAVLLLLAACLAFAGDAAVFSDIGFSEDGLTYVFGQYGKTDKLFQAWAEIYTVDVAQNEFVRNEVYKTAPSAQTTAFSGKTAYERLCERTRSLTAKYKCVPSQAQNLLYVRESETKAPTDEIVFKDFEGSTEGNDVVYHVRLVPTYEGSGKATRSRFYIQLEKRGKDDALLVSRTVGTPDFMRAGVIKYRIDRIFTDNSGRSLVFIVEKTVQDDTGISIRYMVETVRL